jgi:hypothetical protein
MASYLLIPVLAILALVSWGFASPAGSTPDEGFHLQSIWCGNGETAMCAPGDIPKERSVSNDLIDGAICYANNPVKTPSCQGADYGDDLTENLVSGDGGNFFGLYPPVYYFVMSFFAGDNLQVSVLVMRAFNSIVFVGLATALFFLLPKQRRPTLVVAILATFVPLGLYLVASVNPSGWAVMSAAMLWLALLGYFESLGRRRVALGVLAVLLTTMSAGARADGAVYSTIAIVVVVLLRAELTRRFALLALLPLALVASAILWFLSAGQSNAASTGLSTLREGNTQYALLVENVLNLPRLFSGVFGGWPLGWLDTPLPAIVPFAGTLVFGGMVILGFAYDYRRRNLAAILAVGALCAIPLILLYQSDSLVGAQVQPRYILPLLVLAAGVMLLQPAGRHLLITPAQAVIVASALAVSNAVALHENIRRYVTGVGRGGGNLDAGVQWWWDAGPSPMGIWVLGSLSFAFALLLLARLWVAYSSDVRRALLPSATSLV